jgi:hypothetical protein
MFRFTVVFTVSLYCGRMHFSMYKICRVQGVFVSRTTTLHRRAGSCWRVEFQLQKIHRYTDNAPIITDFANSYHDPIAISFS